MKKLKFLILLSFLILTGCLYRNVDYIYFFHIDGLVLDKKTELPLKYVKVIFVDESLDDSRKVWKGRLKKMSDSDGIINI